jgi:hypothetical protein
MNSSLYLSISTFLPTFCVIPEVVHVDLMAIGNMDSFQTLSSSELASFKLLDATFFCDSLEDQHHS